jgi:tagaturonate reductase
MYSILILILKLQKKYLLNRLLVIKATQKIRMMYITKENLKHITTKGIEIPSENIFALPEKVLQFGTGVLLRALPDYFIDKANKQGIFNGRVVVVKSTDGDSTTFDKQDGLYTICVKGSENNIDFEENIINASISRVISAVSKWHEVLDCAANPEIKIVISNTTEVGIQLVHEDVLNATPTSFPGKLLAFLYQRYKVFNGSTDSGMVIIPTELISDNALKLKAICLQLAEYNKLENEFSTWLNEHNRFCNSLVDRIVPGKPNKETLADVEKKLGYTDELLCMSEVFRLWAIEADEKVKDILSFATVDDSIVVTTDITLYKELKLRLLNGTHTFNCGLAFLSGFNVTRDAVTDDTFAKFAKKIMHTEIAKSIPFTIDEKTKINFANKVFDRFCNPFINHQWQSITVQYTGKMKMRNIPLIQNYYSLYNTVPMYMATGFAAYVLYMKVVKIENNKYYGQKNGEYYEIVDDSADYFYKMWKNEDISKMLYAIMQDKGLWEIDLTALPNFYNVVNMQLQSMIQNGVSKTITELVNKIEILNEA